MPNLVERRKGFPVVFHWLFTRGTSFETSESFEEYTQICICSRLVCIEFQINLQSKVS